MKQYIVLTVQGKITQSVPELPLYENQLAHVNNGTHNRVIDRLAEVMPGIIDCQIMAEKINWETDSVLHILTTQ